MDGQGTLDQTDRIMARLAERMGFDRQGFFETGLPGVRFFWTDRPVPRAPLLYDSGIVIIGQGSKTAYAGDKVLTYDRDHYLVLSLPLAFECETRASPAEPLMGIFIDVDIPTLFELAEMVPEKDRGGGDAGLGAEPVRMSAAMREAAARLLTCLCDPDDTAVLGTGLVREVLYRALQGTHAGVLRAMIRPDSRHARIARVLRSVKRDVSEKRSVEQMAAEAGMSSAAFYRAFRDATGSSPLQYIKKLRLTKARSLISHDGMRANDAAFQVGYESASQFSREFKAYFGVTAAEARESAYAFIRS